MLIKSYITCSLSYILALLTAIFVIILLNKYHPLLALFVADLSATIVIFIIGSLYKNASFYDAYWSVFPLLIIFYWLINSDHAGISIIRQVVIVILVSVWSIRLTYNWVRQWQGLRHEDWRYSNLRKSKGKMFWLVNLTGIHLMPTILVFLGSLSLFPSLALNNNPFNFIDIIAGFITLCAIFIETVADQQLNKFIRTRDNREEIINVGLWKYSRHPNYFGEILFWWGLYLFALAANFSYWWVFIGPLSISILFLVVSIPLIEKRLKNKPEYECYKRNVSKLIIWFAKN